MKKITSILALFFYSILSFAQLSEGFEGNFPTIGWTVMDNGIGTSESWTQSTFANSGSYSANIGWDDPAGVAEDYLISPAILVSSSNTNLIFHHTQDYSSDYGSIYEIMVSTTTQTDTANFITLVTYTESDFDPLNFDPDTVDFSAYANQTIYIAFKMSNDDGDSWYIDDINFPVDPPTCLPTTSLVSNMLSSTSVELNWTENNSATEWQMEYGTTGFIQGTGNLSIVNNDTITVTGLSLQTSYDVYVRSICGVGDTSNWSVLTFYFGYCQPAPTTVDNDGITNVSIGSINNSTLTEINNYGDYSNLVADVNRSTNVLVDITYSTGYSYDTKVWVDWNQDYDFDDLGEEVYSGTSLSTNPTTLTASFNVPPTAPLDTLRMRIGGADSGPITSCYTGSYASFEDYSINVLAAPTCLVPNNLTMTNITSASADLFWMENNSATEWQLEYGSANFTQGSGTLLNLTTPPPYNLTGLSGGTTYDWYVRSVCAVGDTSTWTSASSFTTCPSGSVCEIYSAGDIASDYDFYDLTSFPSSCPGNMSLVIPAGNKIDSISTTYEMTAGNGAWMSEQVSRLYSPTTLIGETSVTDGYGSSAGTYSYSRSGLSFANGATDTVLIEMHAGRTYGGSGCDPSYNRVDNGTWVVAAYYSMIPACAEPYNLKATNDLNAVGSAYVLSWNDTNNVNEWQIEFDTSNFLQGTGNLSIVTDDTANVSGLSTSTSYEFYVRAICGPGDTSTWAGPFNFVTPCLAVMAPLTENFDALPLTSPYTMLPTCWEPQSGSDDWDVTNDVTNTGHSYLPNIGDHTTGSSNYMWIDASADILSNGMVTPYIDMSSMTAPNVGFWFASNNTTNSINHTINLDAWDGSNWVNIASKTGNFPSWVEVAGILPSTIPNITKFKIYASANPAGTSGNYFYNDLGVDDFFVREAPINEIKLSNVIAPSQLCAGPQNISLELVNLGGNVIDSVDIFYSLNAFSGSLNYSTPMNPGDTAIVSLGAYPFAADTVYNVQIYTFNPNGTADSNPLNDTITISGIRTGLNGAYTIDNSSPTNGANFNTITEFSNAMKAFGMCGTTVANLAPGVHSGQLDIINNPYPVIINGSDTSLATLTHDGSIRNATIFLQNANDITIVNTTIEATGGTDSWGIHLFENVNDVVIAGNRLKMSVASTTDKALISISGSETSNTTAAVNVNDISITGNSFYGGNIAVNVRGGTAQTERSKNIQITGNNISMQDDYGIYAYYTDSLFIAGNVIYDLQSTTSDGIYLSDLENFTITGNYSTGVDNALSIEDANSEYQVFSNAIISNNMLIGGDDGMYITDMHKTNIFHNTVYAEDYGMYLNDPDSLDIRNNIFYSNSDYAIYSLDSVYSVVDYNIYHTNGTGNLFRFGGTTAVYADLVSFQAAVPSLNINSIEGDPLFFGPNDLHVFGPLANDVGDNTVGITSDIDGDTRPLAPSTTVDIGADEFFLASCLPPTSLTATGITSSSAVLGWTENNSATSWEVEYGLSGFTQGTGTSVIVNSNPTTIIGINHTSDYDFYVRAICAVGDSSAWGGPGTFVTLCGAYTAPYSQNFDNAPATTAFSGVTCWTATGPGATDVDLVTSPDGSNIGSIPSLPNAVEFNDGTFNSDTSLLVSPQFSGLGTGLNRIRFQAAFESTSAGEGIYVGVMSDPNVASTFLPIDTIDASDIGGIYGFGEVIINLTNTALIGANEYIAFAHGDGTGNFEAYIDNFVYEAIPAVNIGVSAIIRPNTDCGLGASDSVEVTITNYGTAAQSNFTLAYSLNGVAISPETYTGTINPFSSANYSFATTANLATVGNYSITAYTLLAGDTITNNDSSTKAITNMAVINTLPYAESFENGAANWFVEGVNTSWELGAPSNTIIDTASDGTEAWVTDLDANYGDGETGFVNSPCFDFTGISDPYLEMDIWYDIEGTWDGAILQSSIDGGTTWNRVGSLGDPNNWYPDTSAAIVGNGLETHGDAWTGNGTSGSLNWITAEHALTGLGNLPSVRLRMVFASDGATTNEGMAFDNIHIYNLGCAGIPNNTVASAPDSVCINVDFDILANGSSNAAGLTYQWEESVAGSGIWTAISGAIDSNYTIVGGIGSAMEYRFISNCTNSGLSDTSNTITVEISHRNACYCTVGFPNGTLPITLVDFAGINNVTSASPNGTPELEDFTSQIGTVTQGSSYTITVEGNTDGNYTDEYQVYFDWNQDGDLDDANESYYIGSITNSTGTDNIQASGSVAVPASALTGNTRMRVVKNYSVVGSACVVDQYGQAEDYTVTIVTPVNISQYDVDHNFVLSPNPSNGFFNISAEGLENGKGRLLLRDISGKIIYSEEVEISNGSLKTQVDVHEFAKGVYFFSFNNGNQNIIKKVVIQ